MTTQAKCGSAAGSGGTIRNTITVLGLAVIGMRAVIGAGGQPKGRGNKKAPVRRQGQEAGKGNLLSAGTGRAGPGTAAATTYRIGGGDRETGTVAGINEIYLNSAAGVKQALIDQKCQLVFLKHLVVVF